MGESIPLSRRVTSAAAVVLMNVILWMVIPWYLSALLSQDTSASPISGIQFVFFGAAITGLQFLGAITRGRPISVPFVSGANLAVALYLWQVFGGGEFTLVAAGIPLALSLRTLLFLMMLPFLFNSVRAPVEFLLEQGEANRPAADIPGLP